ATCPITVPDKCKHLAFDGPSISYFAFENGKIYRWCNIRVSKTEQKIIAIFPSSSNPSLWDPITSKIKSARCYQCVRDAGDLHKLINNMTEHKSSSPSLSIEKTKK
ncbi:MAG: hypothetical protein V4487_01125, partial [Chlamydiota bacterium]